MDKRTFKICEAVHLGLDYYYVGTGSATNGTHPNGELRQ